MGITYRSEKGSALTIEELDNNFRYLTGSQSITGSLTVSGSVTTIDPNGTLGTGENPWQDLYISPNSIVFVSGSVSASLGYPEGIMTSGSSTTSSMVDNGGGITLLYSGSLVTGMTTASWTNGLPTGSVSTAKTFAQQGGFHEFHFSYRDKYGYSYCTGSHTLFGLITSSARESNSFLVRVYSNENTQKSVFYTNSGSVEIGNINPVTGEGDLIAYLRPIGGFGVQMGYPIGAEIDGNANVSFQVSKTAPFTYTNSGSFLISASASGNTITFTTLDGNNFDVNVSISGGVNTIYTGDDSLTSNRTVDLDGNNLTFAATGGETFTIALDNGSTIKTPNLLSGSTPYVLGYNTSSGQISYLSTSSFEGINQYLYVPSNATSNTQLSGSNPLPLSDISSIKGGISSPTVTSDEITIQQDGVYKIEYNAIVSSSTGPFSANSWWSVQLKLNQGGNISYPVTTYAVEAGPEPWYGSTHLMYVGSLNTNDIVSFLGNTPDSTIDYLQGRVFVRKIS